MYKFLNLILALILGLSISNDAQAFNFLHKKIRCEAVFDSSITDVINIINAETGNFLFKTDSVKKYTEEAEYYNNFSFLRKRRIRKLLTSVELRDLTSSLAVEKYSIELSSALFGERNTIDSWIISSKEQHLKDSTIYLIKEKILHDGLMKTWAIQSRPENMSKINKILDGIWRLQNSKFSQLTRLPFILPNIKNTLISKELMFKIIRDGFDAHADEAKLELKLQTQKDAYLTFRRIYAPIVMGLVLSVTMTMTYNDYRQSIDDQVNHTVAELKSQRQNLEINIPKVKQELFNQAYKQSIENFITKWGEQPTEEEALQIRNRIRTQLKCDHC